MIAFCEHAVERYRERVKPAFDYRQARDELRRLAELMDVRPDGPPWREEHHGDADAWARLSDGIWFPLQARNGTMVAATCLTNGGLSDLTRARRNERAQRRRQRAQERRERSERRQRRMKA